MTQTPTDPPPDPSDPSDPSDPAGTGPAAGTTRTEPRPAGADDGPRVSREQVRDLGRLRRTSGSERKIAGVAGGVGRHLDVDPVIIRVALVVLTFFGGAGLILYAALWLLLPDDRSTSAPLGLDDRSRGIGLVAVGVVAALAVLGTSFGDGLLPLPVIVLALAVAYVVVRVSRRRTPAAPLAPYAAQPPYAQPLSGEPGGSSEPWTSSEPGGYAPTSPYAAPAMSAPAWTPTAPAPVPAPRKPGPVLFWFTLALSALGLGVLGTIDVAGADVPGSAYPALVVGLCGLMLVVGAFWGRAGGLIAVGLLAAVALAGSLAGEQVDSDPVVVRPTSAAEVRPTYRLDVGELVLDLSDVTDVAALDGRTITLTAGLGRIEVIYPDTLAVDASAEVSGPGQADLPGSIAGGIGVETSGTTPPSTQDLPRLDLDLSIDVGELVVRQADPTDTTSRSNR